MAGAGAANNGARWFLGPAAGYVVSTGPDPDPQVVTNCGELALSRVSHAGQRLI